LTCLPPAAHAVFPPGCELFLNVPSASPLSRARPDSPFFFSFLMRPSMVSPLELACDRSLGPTFSPFGTVFSSPQPGLIALGSIPLCSSDLSSFLARSVDLLSIFLGNSFPTAIARFPWALVVPQRAPLFGSLWLHPVSSLSFLPSFFRPLNVCPKRFLHEDTPFRTFRFNLLV